jgi:ubiquinone/menaquinone biosynthesis C-methylase UbiE
MKQHGQKIAAMNLPYRSNYQQCPVRFLHKYQIGSPLNDMITHASFENAQSVFELGCGTGSLAARLLAENLPDSASYLGIDISHTMVDITKRRISKYPGRAKARQSNDPLPFPLCDHSVDRVVSTYVFDLLPEIDIIRAVSEAGRALTTNGKLCVVSLTYGVTFISRVITILWSLISRLHAQLVGGCRPVRLDSYINKRIWSVEYHNVVVQYGVPSEVLIATPTRTQKA